MNKDNIKNEIINEVEDDPRCQKDYVEYQELNDACFMTKLNSIVLKKFYNAIVPLPVVHEKEQPLIQYFEKNNIGDDFVVGDIHCQFDQLNRQLYEMGFNPKKDRLFSVGDLIDRGKDGYRVLNYLSQDWFHSVLGNHCDMILSLLSVPEGHFKNCFRDAMNNGAQWLTANNINLAELLHNTYYDKRRNKKNDLTFEKLMADFPLLKRIYYELSKLPYLIKIADIAIIHAEVPLNITDFSELVAKIEDRHIETLESLLWGRERIENDINKKVKGIDRIYCGHSIMQNADDYSNHRMIDIGAYRSKSGKLHIEKIDFKKNKSKSTRIKINEVEPRFDEQSGYTYIRILDLSKEDQKLFKDFLYGGSMPYVRKEEKWGAAWVHDYKRYLESKRRYIKKYNGLEEFKKSLIL